MCSVAVLFLQLDYERDNPSASTFTVRRRRTREPPCFFFERVRRAGCSCLFAAPAWLSAHGEPHTGDATATAERGRSRAGVRLVSTALCDAPRALTHAVGVVVLVCSPKHNEMLWTTLPGWLAE